MSQEALSALSQQEYLSVTSYKRDGRGVATPVWFVVDGERIYFRTPGNTGKVKRLRANPRVSFAACDRSGRRVGPTFQGRAGSVGGEVSGRVVTLLDAKYGMVSRLYGLSLRLPRRRPLVIEITPDYPVQRQ